MTGRDRLLVGALGILAVLAAAWMLVLGPKRSEVSALDAQIATAQQQINDARQQTLAALGAQRDYHADTAVVAALGKALPEDDQVASLLFQLDAAAGQSHVKLKSISPGTASATPAAPTGMSAALPAGVSEVSLSLAFVGRYADLQRFLKRVYGYTSVTAKGIQVNGRLLSIGDFQMSADGTKPGRVQATVIASAYVAAAPAAPSAVGAPAATGQPAAAAATPAVQTAIVGAGG